MSKLYNMGKSSLPDIYVCEYRVKAWIILVGSLPPLNKVKLHNYVALLKYPHLAS